MNDSKEQAIFFLDAHYEGPCDHSPLMFELQSIARAKRKDHVVMIDDVRLFGGELPDPLDRVVNAVWNINHDYKIVYENSNTHEKDVLVAYL